MEKEANEIKLPKGLIERSLGGCLALCMGLALAGAAIGLTSVTPLGLIERIVKIAAIEFLTMVSLYCFLVLIWCVCRPKWIQNTVNMVMKNFLPLVLLMSIGALLFLGVSLVLT